MGCHRLWCQGILLNSWHLFHLVGSGAGAAGVGCIHGAGGNAGCAAKKWGLVGAFGVAVVPLGTVLAALTLCSWRCLRA